ncbi:MAG TPA: CHC2 zinc finger domain-containing protein [Thermoanaerobaculaceae bacterium]|nr:CHC2 zinc finger domain-containing protein [Thermoanaerobaculaceae bacterium]HPS79173.1 CHC2 zinc finger domain-containing protein [Thermoanaerobaculaceae bacterium]
MARSLDELKRRAPILDVARALEITVKGKVAMCFRGHDRATPSLRFDPAKDLWYCFSCQKGGSSIDLVMAVLDLTLHEAVAWLQSRYSVETCAIVAGQARSRAVGARKSGPNLTSEKVPPSELQGTPDQELYRWVLDRSPISSRGLEYLLGRGFSEAVVSQFGLGEQTAPGRLFREAAEQWGHDRLRTAGLLRIPDEGSGAHGESPVWWDAVIVIPFSNTGKVSYLQARRLRVGQPKYLNLIGIGRPLFNCEVLPAAPAGSAVLICEGVLDAIAASQLGYAAVAALGVNHFKREWVRDFRGLRAFAVPDMDRPGREFGQRLQGIFAEFGEQLEVLSIPRGKDLAEYLSLSGSTPGRARRR